MYRVVIIDTMKSLSMGFAKKSKRENEVALSCGLVNYSVCIFSLICNVLCIVKLISKKRRMFFTVHCLVCQIIFDTANIFTRILKKPIAFVLS